MMLQMGRHVRSADGERRKPHNLTFTDTEWAALKDLQRRYDYDSVVDVIVHLLHVYERAEQRHRAAVAEQRARQAELDAKQEEIEKRRLIKEHFERTAAK